MGHRKNRQRKRVLLETGFGITLTIGASRCPPRARNSSKGLIYINSFLLFHAILIRTLKGQTNLMPGLEMMSRNTEGKLPCNTSGRSWNWGA